MEKLLKEILDHPLDDLSNQVSLWIMIIYWVPWSIIAWRAKCSWFHVTSVWTFMFLGIAIVFNYLFHWSGTVIVFAIHTVLAYESIKRWRELKKKKD